MKQLGETQLFITALWDHDWAEIVEEAEGGERALVANQARLVELLRALEGALNTPENIAWITLWARAFNSCDAARGVLYRDSHFGLQILARHVQELMFHTVVLTDPRPSTRVKSSKQPKRDWDEVTVRLQAYTAWCIWNDLENLKFFRKPHILEAVYEPHSARAFIKRLGPFREKWEKLMGEIEEVSDNEAEFDLKTARANLDDRIDRRPALATTS